MQVAFVDLKRQYETIKNDIDKAIQNTIATTNFVLGEEPHPFEINFAKYCGKKYCVGVGSGTAALELALRAYNITSGEVITTPSTFFSGASVINMVGAEPVFVDVEKESNNIDPKKIEAAITKKTKAIIVTHLYGRPADMDPILNIAQKHNLIIIEDAAQAHGTQYKGKIVPYGETGCFSFYPGKILGAYGDGGAVVTDNKEVAERVKSLRNFGGSFKQYTHKEIAGNHRLHGLQATILDAKLKHLPAWVKLRQQHAARYTKLLQGIVKTPELPSYGEHSFYVYVIETEQRDALVEYLKQHNIPTRIHYPTPIHLQPAYAYKKLKEGSFPIAEWKAKRILAIPLFPELKKEEQDYIVEHIKKFFKQ
ncbi:MAG: DegT/DnrJ/EryC1/StrS family aminotransferase [Nanoarchaeota archaeon]|nr:DegT/DnrJ/EryC1/StrS family aminotransferase [Nanoarchaeota archaeon]